MRVTWSAEHLFKPAWSPHACCLAPPRQCNGVILHVLYLFRNFAYTLVLASSLFCAFLDAPVPGDVVCPKVSVRVSASRPLPDLTRRPNHALDDCCILAAEHLPHLHHLQRLRDDELGRPRLQRLICAMLHLNPCHGNGRLQGTAQELTLCGYPPSSICFAQCSHPFKGTSIMTI